MHAFKYTTGKKYIGKKVIVVGAATSGHDVAFDLANHGVGTLIFDVFDAIHLTFFRRRCRK